MNKIPQWVVNITVCLLLSAYGFIFTGIIHRIETNEIKLENNNVIFLRIQTDIAAINTNIEWVKRQLQQYIKNRGGVMKIECYKEARNWLISNFGKDWYYRLPFKRRYYIVKNIAKQIVKYKEEQNDVKKS